MSVSRALENSAKAFNTKYACNFDFATFELRIEEFTFLRPNGGWIDVYKMMFGRMYRQALEAAVEFNVSLNGEAMLDDYEYMLIRPFVNETKIEIRHKHYAGMDRIARLEYLGRLTREAPKNPVELCSERYKRGDLTLGQMTAALNFENADREWLIRIAGYVQALEVVNKSRSTVWRTLHPLKNSAEKRDAALMRNAIIEAVGGEKFYGEIVEAAYETFNGHRMANEYIAECTLHAVEEMNRLQKMNDVIRKNLGNARLMPEPSGD